MSNPVYETDREALAATDEFYRRRGFEYAPEQARASIRTCVPGLPEKGAVLDLCCGDGTWSRALKDLSPGLTLYGIDLSAGGIEVARERLPEDADRFVVGDAERGLPWPDGTFDLVFARGPGLYNQHSMDRPAAVAVIETWHRALKPDGRFVSIFYSHPERFGTYTDPQQVALPYNRAPRHTDAVDFRGGKFHHSEQSFLAPFRLARNVRMIEYRFVRNQHVLETRRRSPEPAARPGDPSCYNPGREPPQPQGCRA